jgi:hypothetical protein
MEALQKAIDELGTQVQSKLDAMSTEVKQLATHVADVQDGVDSVKRSQVELGRTAASRRDVTDTSVGIRGAEHAMPQATAAIGVPGTGHRPALANHGPPLMPHPQDAHQVVDGMPDHEQWRSAPKPPKHQFPRFSGDNPSLWLDMCETYFTMYQTPVHQRVSSAVLYMEGHAALWLQAHKRRTTLGTWEQFCADVLNEFGDEEYDGQMARLNKIKQTGSVADYRKEFEACMYHLISLDPALHTKFFVSQFVLGLRPDIRAVVRIQAPNSVSRAASLARIQEEEMANIQDQQSHIRGRATAVAKPMAIVPVANAVGSAPQAKCATDDFARERQLRDFRKANGLCFRCGDKYSKEHQCKQASQLLTIQLGDFGEILSADTVHALELLEESAPAAECCHISVHAIAGTESSVSLRLRTMVGNQLCLILVDSGSSHSFVNAEFARRVGANVQAITPVQVKVANNQTMYSNYVAPDFSWWIQGHTFSHDMRLLELGAYDAIIGMDWLELFDPMICRWKRKAISFTYKGQDILLQGVLPKAQQSIHALELNKLQTWLAGNEVWSLALLEPVVAATPPSVHNSITSVPGEVQQLLHEFQDVFQEPTSLPPHREFDHAISLEPAASPVNSRPYRYSPLQKDEIERQVSEMLKTGVITRSISPYASPVLLVQKKDATWRFCVDYRRLNDITIKNKFPLPIIDELLDELAGTQYFSKLDLRAGYHQIRMCETDEPKTAFKTHHGHFQFRVMPFGLTNAPATFQCIMNDIFAPYIRKFVIVFLDDILIYSNAWAQHLLHLRAVLTTLREKQFYAKLSKCSFAQTSICYLGHVISAAGVATEADKTDAIEKWPLPTNVTDLRGFLGLTGYYRKFVKNYGILAKPLTNLLTKKGFQWTDQATIAFNLLKQALMSTPVLALPNFALPFTVETDACDTGIGAVLTQQGHPVAYLSKALGQQNCKLSIYEKEFLAVMMAIDRWRPYLQRGQFTILTDHKSLSNLGDQQLHSHLQRKAMSKLMGLQYTFQYRRGQDNNAADSLSRVAHVLHLDMISSCRPDWVKEVYHSYDVDSSAQELLTELAVSSPNSKGYSLEQGLIKYQGRIYIGANSALQTKLIANLHDSAAGGHSGIQATYQRVRKLFFWPGLKTAVEEFVKQCLICQQAKHEHTHPAGTLQPLPIPTQIWEHLTMDFITGLPLSDGADVIMVVVDRLTKSAHFLALRHPYTALQVAHLFLDNVVRLHGVPRSIVSDRDAVFTSVMWREIMKSVGTTLNYSTAHHPQTDGQSERVNQCLEQYLRCFVQDCPRKWRRALPMAEFWYNSSVHSSLGCSPFKALYGVDPSFGAMPNVSVATDSPVFDAMTERQALTDMIRAQLQRAQDRIKRQADKQRTDREFSVGDSVLLKLQPYAQSSVVNRPFQKLAFKYFGPYKIVTRVGAVAYQLALPPDSKVHPVFHISQLKPYIPKYSPVFTTLPSALDFDGLSSVPEHILDRRMVKKDNAATTQVLVKWSQLPEESATWEDYYQLRERFPDAPCWEAVPISGGESVTPRTTNDDVA